MRLYITYFYRQYYNMSRSTIWLYMYNLSINLRNIKFTLLFYTDQLYTSYISLHMMECMQWKDQKACATWYQSYLRKLWQVSIMNLYIFYVITLKNWRLSYRLVDMLLLYWWLVQLPSKGNKQFCEMAMTYSHYLYVNTTDVTYTNSLI